MSWPIGLKKTRAVVFRLPVGYEASPLKARGRLNNNGNTRMLKIRNPMTPVEEATGRPMFVIAPKVETTSTNLRRPDPWRL